MAFQKGTRRRGGGGGGGGGGVRLTPREMGDFGLETVFSSSSSYVQIKRTKKRKCKKRTEEKKTKKRTTTTGVGPRSECSTHNTFKLFMPRRRTQTKKDIQKVFESFGEERKKKKKKKKTHQHREEEDFSPFVRRCFG